MHKTFIITDLHLTDSIYDEYKWNVFSWAREHLCNKRLQINELFILGDLLDKKDRHPAELINRLVNEIELCAKITPVTILKGNHDYLKPEHPFLELLSKIENVRYIKEPEFDEDGEILWLPHAREPEVEWANIDVITPKIIFLHQSVIGSIVSNYHEMKGGLSPSFFKGTKAKIISGDIHVPQDIKIARALPLTYVGTPHPVSFGDTYTPRGILLDLDTREFTTYNHFTIQKLSLTISEPYKLYDSEIHPNDQLKITVDLESNKLSHWAEYKEEIKKICEKEEWILRDLKVKKKETLSRLERAAGKKENSYLKASADPIEVLKTFSKKENLDPEIEKEGLELLK